MTSDDVLKILAVKHSKDVFVPECKTGASQAMAHRRLDAWVMPRSWAHPAITGYEIKVSRRDFMQDLKLTDYLQYCNYLYIVAPKDVLDPRELPEGVGYMQVTANRALTKVKAAYRDVKIPESIFRYVLMCRTRVCREYGDTEAHSGANRRFWSEWLKEKKVDADLGWRVSKALHTTIEDEIRKLQRKNAQLEHENDELKPLKEVIEKLGLSRWNAAEEFERKWNSGSGAHSEAIDNLANEAMETLRKIKLEAR